LLQQKNKRTLLTPESLEQQILPQKFVRNFAAAALPPPPRASPENQNLQGETSHRDDDAGRGRRRLYFFFFFFFRFFLISLGARENKKDDRAQVSGGYQKWGEPGNRRFSKQ